VGQKETLQVSPVRLAEVDDSEEFGSDSEGESLGGYIIGCSHVSDVDDASSE
jgi:hypothetical protein